MQWKEACLRSPRHEAFRWRRPGQRMTIRPDAHDPRGYDCFEQARPNYALYEDVRDPPQQWTDWLPEGFHADALMARRLPRETPEFEYGFLSPRGGFFACRYHEHDVMAEGILYRLTRTKVEDTLLGAARDRLIEEHGWAVLTSALWFVPENWTPAQRDWIWDWAVRNHKDMPAEFRDEPRTFVHRRSA